MDDLGVTPISGNLRLVSTCYDWVAELLLSPICLLIPSNTHEQKPIRHGDKLHQTTMAMVSGQHRFGPATGIPSSFTCWCQGVVIHTGLVSFHQPMGIWDIYGHHVHDFKVNTFPGLDASTHPLIPKNVASRVAGRLAHWRAQSLSFPFLLDVVFVKISWDSSSIEQC